MGMNGTLRDMQLVGNVSGGFPFGVMLRTSFSRVESSPGRLERIGCTECISANSCWMVVVKGRSTHVRTHSTQALATQMATCMTLKWCT